MPLHILVCVCLSVLLLCDSAQASTCGEYNDICAFVEQLKTRASSISLENENVRVRLEEEVDKVLDFDEISKFVLGRHWKLASGEQKQGFRAAYGNYIRGIYVTQLQHYAMYKMKIMSVKALDERTYTVRVRLSKVGRSDDFVVLEFYVARGDKLKISDIRVNNSISILVNQRVVVHEMIKEHGLDKVIDHFVRAK